MGEKAEDMGSASEEQAVDAVSDLLRDAGTMSNVLAFLPGYWLILGAVCSEWKAIYAGMPDQQVRSIDSHGNSKLVTYGSKATLYSAAVASPATARLACDFELAINKNGKLQLIAVCMLT
jgi:hypothetical protein